MVEVNENRGSRTHDRRRLVGVVAVASATCGLAVTAGLAGECVPAWDNAIGQPGLSNAGRAMVVFDDGSGGGPALYAAGDFISAGGQTVNKIAKWDGQKWSPLAGGAPGATLIFALAVFDDGSGPALYAGGDFTSIGGVSANRIAKWDGASWSALGTPGSGVAGGNFGITTVEALTVWDDGSGPALYVGGQFTVAGGNSANYIAKWDGASWSPLGSGMGSGGAIFIPKVTALAVHDGALYAGGGFITAGGTTVNRIARWDGQSWSALGGGMSGLVLTLQSFDDGLGDGPVLFAGGGFAEVEGEQFHFIARWNGEAWSPLKAGLLGPQFQWLVNDLAVYDDGSGPALYAGGQFLWAGDCWCDELCCDLDDCCSDKVATCGGCVGGVTGSDLCEGNCGAMGGPVVNRIAKWDGVEWSPLGSGIDGSNVRALAVFDDGSGTGPALYASGVFTGAGGLASSRIAKWQGCPPDVPDCPADLTGDGNVGVADLLELLAAWGETPGGGHPADLTGDGNVGVADLLELLAAWGPCP